MYNLDKWIQENDSLGSAEYYYNQTLILLKENEELKKKIEILEWRLTVQD